MTDTLLEPPRTEATVWSRVCALSDLDVGWGEAALVGRDQVALFRLDGEEVLAVDNRDPATGACVISRGITGSRRVSGLGERATVTSPLHKEVYDLVTGACLTSPALRLRTFATRVVGGYVEVAG